MCACVRACVRDCTFASLPRCNSGDNHAISASLDLADFEDACKSFSRAVGSVVRGHPRQSAASVDAKYLSMASSDMRSTCPNRLHIALVADKFSGLHANFR